MRTRILLTDEHVIPRHRARNLVENPGVMPVLGEARHDAIGGRLTAGPALSTHSDRDWAGKMLNTDARPPLPNQLVANFEPTGEFRIEMNLQLRLLVEIVAITSEPGCCRTIDDEEERTACVAIGQTEEKNSQSAAEQSGVKGNHSHSTSFPDRRVLSNFFCRPMAGRSAACVSA